MNPQFQSAAGNEQHSQDVMTDSISNSKRMGLENHKHRFPPAAVANNIGSLFGDILSLAELQMKLLKRDAAETVQRTYFAAGLLAIGALLLLACLPIAMLTIALLLREFTQLTLGQSLSIVLGSGLVAAFGAAAYGWFKLKRVGNIFRRSEEEFTRNVEWLKKSMKR